MRWAAFAALLLCALPAMAQPVLEERLLLTVGRQVEPPGADFPAPAAAPSGFQTRITRPSIRDHLREYRIRVLNDGVAVQKRFIVGK